MEKWDRASQVVWEIVTKQAGEISKRDWYFTRQIVAVKEEKLKHNSITELRMYLWNWGSMLSANRSDFPTLSEYYQRTNYRSFVAQLNETSSLEPKV